MLTKKQKQTYLKNKGYQCPYCNSARISEPGTQLSYIDLSEITSKVTCLDCDKQWLDVFKLTDIIGID